LTNSNPEAEISLNGKISLLHTPHIFRLNTYSDLPNTKKQVRINSDLFFLIPLNFDYSDGHCFHAPFSALKAEP
jgi:hypothetical protein